MLALQEKIMEILSSVIAAITSIAGAAVLSQTEVISKVIEYLFKIFKNAKQNKIETYSEKISRLNIILKKSSIEIDSILEEMEEVSKDRNEKIVFLEKNLAELSIKESKVKERIEILQKTPIEAISKFEEIINNGDKKSSRRDYFIFGLGVIVSTLIAILLKLIFNI